MTWKRLDAAISESEKFATVSLEAVGVWTHLLANSDSKGRMIGIASVIVARYMPFRAAQAGVVQTVERLVAELVEKGRLHAYEVQGKRYLVAHDIDDFNPPGAMRYNKPRFPDPPPGLCKCLSPHAAKPVEHRHQPDDVASVIAQRLARERKMPNKPATILGYVNAVMARGFGTALEAWSSDAANDGKDVTLMQDELTKKNGKPVKPPAPQKPTPPPAPPAPVVEKSEEEVIAGMLADISMMKPSAARWSIKHGRPSPYPKVQAAMEAKAAEVES